MKKNFFRMVLGLLVVVLLVLWIVTFQVREGRVAVVTRFGKAVRTIEEAGLQFKWPWPLEKVQLVDVRRRIYNTRFRETLTEDKKNVILHTYAVWSVENPLRFLQSLGTTGLTGDAEMKLDGMISNAKNAVMGKYPLKALVSTNPEDLKVDEIEESILEDVAKASREKLGIKIHQVGFKTVALPEENVRYVFRQMRMERSQFSAKAQAEGKKESRAIMDQTDVDKAKILAQAKEEAAKIRGEAEAEAARLFAEAQQKAPEFYEWLRSLDSLKQLLQSNSTVILRTDSAPFDLLRKGTAIEEEKGKEEE